MELKDQVVSLELAQKLKELGAKQDTYYIWTLDRDGADEFVTELKQDTKNNRVKTLDHVSAFTVAELGEMLPSMFDIDGTAHQIISNKGLLGRLWYVAASSLMDDKKNSYHIEEADTEADARATMLIFLLENKLIA